MKAGIYCRLSEEDRNKQSKGDDSLSIQNQKSMLLHYAMEKGWEVYGIYSGLDQLITEKQAGIESLGSSQTDPLSKRQKIEKYIQITSLTRSIVEELVGYICVGKIPNASKKQIEINWSF